MGGLTFTVLAFALGGITAVAALAVPELQRTGVTIGLCALLALGMAYSGLATAWRARLRASLFCATFPLAFPPPAAGRCWP